MSKSMPSQELQHTLRNTFGRQSVPASRQSGKPASRQAGKAAWRHQSLPEMNSNPMPASRQSGKPAKRQAGRPAPAPTVTRKLTCRIDPDLYRQLQVRAIHESRSLSSLVTQVLGEYVDAAGS